MNLDNSRLNQVVEHLGRYVKVLRLKTIVLHIIDRLQKSNITYLDADVLGDSVLQKVTPECLLVSDFIF